MRGRLVDGEPDEFRGLLECRVVRVDLGVACEDSDVSADPGPATVVNERGLDCYPAGPLERPWTWGNPFPGTTSLLVRRYWSALAL